MRTISERDPCIICNVDLYVKWVGGQLFCNGSSVEKFKLGTCCNNKTGACRT